MLSVKHNQRDSKYSLFKEVGIKMPLYIGDQNNFLKPGIHNYKISYLTGTQQKNDTIIYQETLNSQHLTKLN